MECAVSLVARILHRWLIILAALLAPLSASGWPALAVGPPVSCTPESDEVPESERQGESEAVAAVRRDESRSRRSVSIGQTSPRPISDRMTPHTVLSSRSVPSGHRLANGLLAPWLL